MQRILIVLCVHWKWGILILSNADWSFSYQLLVNYLYTEFTTDFPNISRSWQWAHGGCDKSAGDAHSYMAPDPTTDVSEVSVCSAPILYCLMDFDIEYYTIIAVFWGQYNDLAIWGVQYSPSPKGEVNIVLRRWLNHCIDRKNSNNCFIIWFTDNMIQQLLFTCLHFIKS